MSSSNDTLNLSHANSGARSHDRSNALSFDDVPSAQEIPISTDHKHLPAHTKIVKQDRFRASGRPRNIVDNDDHDEEDGDGSTVISELEDERPWYKRPSPWWMLLMSGFVTCVTSMTVAAKTEIFILLACEEYRGIASPLTVLPIDNSTRPISPGHTSAPWQRPESSFTVFFGDGGMPPQYEAKIPRPTSQCRSDPEVGRRVAELGTMVSLVLGLLSVLTTGFWSKLSDSKGRTWVLRFVALGSVLSDINFFAVTLHSRKIAGGYDRFVWSSVADGLVGGAMTRSAAAHAYVSDCALPTARSRMFSLYVGIGHVGMSVGPALGGLLISRTGDLLTPFYVATAGHVVYLLIMCFLIPESLSKRQMAITAEKRRARNDASREIARSSRRTSVRIRRVARALGGFLEPLMVFAPVHREQSGSYRKRDWNLLCIAGASVFVTLLVGAPQFEFQYTAALFDWTSEEIGYWVAAVQVVQSFHLVVLLPLITKIFGPRHADLHVQDIAPDDRNHTNAASSNMEREPLIHSSGSVSPAPPRNSRLNSRHATYNAAFDLRIAKGSLIVDMISAFLTSFAPGPRTFSVVTLLSSLGVGFKPVHLSLALSLMPRGSADAGKLFGAFAVMRSLGHIAGSAVFGTTYILTHFWLPQGIFWLSFLISSVALMLLSFIRLPPALPHSAGVP